MNREDHSVPVSTATKQMLNLFRLSKKERFAIHGNVHAHYGHPALVGAAAITTRLHSEPCNPGTNGGRTEPMGVAAFSLTGLGRGLTQTSATTTNTSGDTTLMKAAALGLIEPVRHLAERGASHVHATNKDGDTALMRASKHGEMIIIKYLVQLCAVDVNAKNSRGYTALLLAAEFGKIEVVRYLAGECGADANAQNAIGDTALMMAVVHGNVNLVRYLARECGADVNLKNKYGNTAVRLAADRGYQEIRRILTPFLLPASQLQTSGAKATAGNGVASSKDLSSCSIPPSEIELAVFSQTGNIGVDYRAKWLDADVVIKLFIPDASHSIFEDEAHLWQKLRHPNVIKMHGACEADPLVKFFVCEYASNGSLIEHVTSASKES